MDRCDSGARRCATPGACGRTVPGGAHAGDGRRRKHGAVPSLQLPGPREQPFRAPQQPGPATALPTHHTDRPTPRVHPHDPSHTARSRRTSPPAPGPSQPGLGTYPPPGCRGPASSVSICLHGQLRPRRRRLRGEIRQLVTCVRTLASSHRPRPQRRGRPVDHRGHGLGSRRPLTTASRRRQVPLRGSRAAPRRWSSHAYGVTGPSCPEAGAHRATRTATTGSASGASGLFGGDLAEGGAAGPRSAGSPPGRGRGRGASVRASAGRPPAGVHEPTFRSPPAGDPSPRGWWGGGASWNDGPPRT